MERVELTVKIDRRLVDRLQETGLDVSEYLEAAAKKQFETMQGGALDKPHA